MTPIDLDAVPANTDGTPATPRTIELFKLGGKSYEIDAKSRPGVGLKFLYDMKQVGAELAAANLLIKLLGEDAYLALCASDATAEQVKAILDLAKDTVLGDFEKVMGNS